MLKLKKVAVTGGLSCGKSLVCRFLSEFGAYVVNADQIVHDLLASNNTAKKQIVDLLGPEVVVGGHIDRSRVAARVFYHPKLLRALENLLHPLVYAEIQRQYQKLINNEGKYTLFVAEVPLLFESKGEVYFDATIAVISNPETCWLRYRKATGYEKEDYNKRMARQFKPEDKAKNATYIIRNDGSEDELKQQVKTIYLQLGVIS